MEEVKERARKRRSGGRIGRNRREVGELEEGESEARRDSRCFVTARVNPASSGAPSHGTLRESSGPATLYTRAFVPMTSLKYGCPFLAGARAQEMGRGRRAAGLHGARASSSTSLRGAGQEEKGRDNRVGEREAFLFPGDIYLGVGGRWGPRFA